MVDTIRRLVWFAVVATAAIFAIFVVLGNFATMSAANSGPVAIHDTVSNGSHQLNGILVLPLQCDELSVETIKISSTVYELAFQTWQDPSVSCPQTPTPRAFEAIAFAPASGTTFIATLDGKGFPITIVPDTSISTNP